MSNITASNYPPARDGSAAARPRFRPKAQIEPEPEYEEVYEDAEEYEDGDEEYDEFLDDDAPVGIFSSPARTVMVIGSMMILLVIGVAIAWKLGEMSKTPVASASSSGSTQAAGIGPKIDKYAPDFTLTDVKTNKAVNLASLRGKPVWINFWGTWCPPCKAEMPEIEQLYQQYKDQVDIIGISMGPRDEPAGVAQFVDLNKYHWQFIHDADSSVMTNYLVTGIPSSFFIDKNGVIRSIRVGGAPTADLESSLKIAMSAQ